MRTYWMYNSAKEVCIWYSCKKRSKHDVWSTTWDKYTKDFNQTQKNITIQTYLYFSMK